MVATRETFTAQAAPELLATMRTIARAEGRDFDATLEDAMRECIAKWKERGTSALKLSLISGTASRKTAA